MMTVWFEIPAEDFDRAKKFYSTILDFDIQEEVMGDTKMGFFPMEGYEQSGAIAWGKDYVPSSDGPVIYLNGGKDLQVILDRVESAGGKIIFPKELVTKEIGYVAWFQDSEGNRIGLWSKN